MPEHRHRTRALAPGEPTEPTEAWIEHPDGSRTDMALARVGPRAWTATASVPTLLEAGAHLRLDRLGARCTVTFVNVMAREVPSGTE